MLGHFPEALAKLLSSWEFPASRSHRAASRLRANLEGLSFALVLVCPESPRR